MLREYEAYVARPKQAMAARFEAGELSWAPAAASAERCPEARRGPSVRWNISDAAVNRRLAARNGDHHSLDWRHPDSRLDAWRMLGACSGLRALRPDLPAHDFGMPGGTGTAAQAGRRDVLGLQSTFRFASLFPQHYAFRARGGARTASAVGPPCGCTVCGRRFASRTAACGAERLPGAVPGPRHHVGARTPTGGRGSGGRTSIWSSRPSRWRDRYRRSPARLASCRFPSR